MLGIVTYVVLNACTGKANLKKISVTMWVLAILFVLRYVLKCL